MSFRSVLIGCTAFIGFAIANVTSSNAAILLSGGTYTQDFDSLSNTGTTNTFTNNSTLPGWYAVQSSGTLTVYRADNGGSNSGALYSYGTTSATERALGSAASGTPQTISYGAQFTNDTLDTISAIRISYTGEQWRNGGNTTAQTLAFSYRVDGTGFVGSATTPEATFTAFSGLNFITPTVGSSAAALDGNLPANQVAFVNVELPGVTLAPGQSVWVRFDDINDAGNDHGVAIDNFSLSFTATPIPEPSTIALSALAGLGFLGYRLRRKQS